MADTSPPASTSVHDTDFDYVIVGSGAGGAPLAARLAEQGYRVLVLEAGPDHRAGGNLTSPAREVTEVPALHAPSNEHPDVRWRFFVKHYENPPGRDPKWSDEFNGIFYPRATGVGGCTIHNAMITIAGPASDWDELAFFLGDPSWKSDVMRGYFQEKVERCEYLAPRPRPRNFLGRAVETFWWLLGRDEDPTVGRHGFDGWLRTSIISLQNLERGIRDRRLLKMLKAAAVTSAWAGMETPWLFTRRLILGETKEALDPNHFRRQTDRPEGLALIPTAVYSDSDQNKKTNDCGHRSSPARRLREVADEHPDRLVIATDCLATKVILEKDPDRGPGTFRATGVEYQHGPRLYRAAHNPNPQPGTLHQIHARREVILCGGAFNTPQLLMLSGIGPAEHLAKVGVECLIDSPGVGENLQDRYEVTVVTKMEKPFSLLRGATFALPTDPNRIDPPLTDWRNDGTGLYTTNGALVGVLKRSRPDLPQPDLFIFGIPLKFKGYAVDFSVVKPEEFDLFTWAILKSHTQNRGGTVRLVSNDPRDRPAINFNYFGSSPTKPPSADDPDLNAIVEGVKFVRQIADNAGKVALGEVHPGRDIVVNDDQIKQWIMREAWGHHACGTCRMGRWTDPDAVTDSRFRVLGSVDPAHPSARREPVRNLRVVDASIFPNIPGYFIVTNIYVASEKAADVIGRR
jgi:choline dehydrogenase